MDIQEQLKIQVKRHVYMFLPEQIKALKQLVDEKTYPSDAIQLMFIPILTTFIESVLSEILEELVLRKRKKDSSFEQRAIDYMHAQVMRSTWEPFKKLFPVIVGEPINFYVPSDVIATIEHLFIFRNQVIHGKGITHSIELDEEDNESAMVIGSYKKSTDYLLEKALITKADVQSIIFINSKVIEHFITNTLQFVKSLTETIDRKTPLLMLIVLRAHVLDKLNSDGSVSF